ncbi:MAG: thiamine pyrophosphate-dependent dehydrogenase E1 component subunit alpha, partial [Rhodospirillaceae bacterium]|nr:thiamine pyrophosphate-dependent dehydrogenase E1 component subunit alpha [Rhodospirillaceae bacterium]
TDVIKSPVHLSIGQEAIPVGVCDILRADDYVAGTYRGHALYLANGGNLNAFMAELYGKIDGCAAGKGGSMHLVDSEHYMIGSSGVVATNIPIALGHALKLKREGKGRIVVCFFGDGATEEGVFYESLNFASLQKLPVLFICENNALAVHTPIERRWAHMDICHRVAGFGIPTHRLDDQNIFNIRSIAEGSAMSIRAGQGPAFMECPTYRWRSHVGPEEDFDANYRPREASIPWIENDQMSVLADLLPGDVVAGHDTDVEADIDAAMSFAANSPFPTMEELHRHVYAE